MKKNIKILVESAIIKALLFLFSASLAFIVSKLVDNIVKPGASYGILNDFTTTGFNPTQNFVKLIAIIVFTIVIYHLFKYTLQKKRALFNILVAIIATFAIFSVVLMPGINGYAGKIDVFHHGEQLSPGNAFNNGKEPYKDIYILHGAGEDILVPALALSLGGKDRGISMYYFITTGLMIVSTALFMLLLSRLFKNTAVFLLITTWFIFGIYSTFFYARDIFVWLAVGIIFILIVNNLPRRAKNILYVSLGSIASLSLFYSIDRAFIVCAMVAAFATGIIFLKIKGNGFLTLRGPTSWTNYIPLLWITGTGLLIQLLGLVVMGASSYGSFLSLSFIDIPKYQGMLFTYPLPDISMASLSIWIPILLTIPAIFMYWSILKSDWAKQKNIDKRSVFIFVILIGCLLFIRSGYGRSDFGHIAYSTPLFFIALFYITTIYIEKFQNNTERYIVPAAIILLLLFPVSSVDFSKVTAFMNVTPRIIAEYIKLPTHKNDHWLKAPLSEVTSYIKSRSTDKDSLFVFTQQPLYYYLTNLENPTRFYIPWFADPDPLEKELLSSLKKKPPTFIIYKSSTGWDNVDGFEMRERTPTVNSWIKNNYSTSKNINGVVILEK